jgi:hypothetical protein
LCPRRNRLWAINGDSQMGVMTLRSDADIAALKAQAK